MVASAAVVQILTKRPLAERRDYDLVMSLWAKYLPELLPERYDNSEPLKKLFDPGNPGLAWDCWRMPFLARRRRPWVESSVWMRQNDRPPHSTWILAVDPKAVPASALAAFLDSASVELDADFGCIELMTSHEISRGLRTGVVKPLNKKKSLFTFFIGSYSLMRCIPDLFWLNVFGEPYLELFGHERLNTAPAWRVYSPGAGKVALQLSSSIDDLGNEPEKVEAVRSAVKAHLGHGAFCDEMEGRGEIEILPDVLDDRRLVLIKACSALRLTREIVTAERVARASSRQFVLAVTDTCVLSNELEAFVETNRIVVFRRPG
jgi:hypothetical protein